MRSFYNLSNERQNKLRKEYKNKYLSDYSYSIHLFMIYVILGLLSIIGLILILLYDVFLGSLIFVLSFIFLIIDLYFLRRSNLKFYEFLNQKWLTK